MTVYRVLVVDDSRFMRQVFSDVIGMDPTFHVAALASDGEEAVRLAMELKPDIITMDMEMPRLNGLGALRRIMEQVPTPVIMLSAVTDNGTRDTIKALQLGAFDFIRKPDGTVKLDIERVGAQLLVKLHTAVDAIAAGTFRMLPAVEDHAEPEAIPPPPAPPPAPPDETAKRPPGREAAGRQPPTVLPPPRRDIRRQEAIPAEPGISPRQAPPPPKSAAASPASPASRTGSAGGTLPAADAAPPLRRTEKRSLDPPAADRTGNKTSETFSQIVAVGTSTGGPRALHELLTKLPADFEAPVLVVQHMPPKFTFSLAQRLDSFSAIRVREAAQGETIVTATAYIAPGGKHMSVVKEPGGTYRIRLTEEGPRSGHMPSVDVLFESLVGHRNLKRHAVLMTGMGSDGAKGMKALKDDGAETLIAESEETCVVFGMPRSAVELGAVTQVLPLQGISQALVREVRSRSNK